MTQMQMTVEFSTHGDLLRAVGREAARWDISDPDLGASLHAMRQLGHWHPFTRASRKLYSEIIADAIAPVPEHQQSRRVVSPAQENADVARNQW